MGIITISMPQELIEKLRQEENYSALIAELVSSYYQKREEKTKTARDILAEFDNKYRITIENLQKEAIEVKKLAEAKLELEEAKEQKELTEAQKLQKKIAERYNSFKEFAPEIFKINPEDLIDLANEFSESELTMTEFCKLKGLEKKA